MHASSRDDIEITPAELFFDLVFAFTTTQLTAVLETGLAPALPSVALILVVLFWMYQGYVWLTNQVPINGVGRRLDLLLGMAGFLICALAAPSAFAGEGVLFGVGYLVLVAVHLLLYYKAYGPEVRRFAPFNILGGLALTASGFVVGATAYAFWVAAVALQFVAAR